MTDAPLLEYTKQRNATIRNLRTTLIKAIYKERRVPDPVELVMGLGGSVEVAIMTDIFELYNELKELTSSLRQPLTAHQVVELTSKYNLTDEQAAEILT